MEYAVSRDGTTLVTLHEGTDTTACDEATNQLSDTLSALADDGAIADWSIDDADVYEHPAAPFDPYTVSVAFSATVVVDAPDRESAEARGETAIAEALAAAGVDAVEYTSGAAASTAG
ncbi:hypothetical protein [Halovivax sp.]|uniref:hypothetical protein n=1 Tax=Halovivax sp. TaxID=1935978 RepID=UPI0025C07193|nr:hypothetical protein [Halovivax sp.]